MRGYNDGSIGTNKKCLKTLEEEWEGENECKHASIAWMFTFSKIPISHMEK